MSDLFGLDIAGILNDAFAGQLHALTLHKATTPLDSYGAPSATFADHDGEGVRLSWDAETAVARGYPLDAAKILVLQNGIVEPSKGDEITIEGDRWQVLDIEKDPADATWTIAGIKV